MSTQKKKSVDFFPGLAIFLAQSSAGLTSVKLFGKSGKKPKTRTIKTTNLKDTKRKKVSKSQTFECWCFYKLVVYELSPLHSHHSEVSISWGWVWRAEDEVTDVAGAWQWCSIYTCLSRCVYTLNQKSRK